MGIWAVWHSAIGYTGFHTGFPKGHKPCKILIPSQ